MLKDGEQSPPQKISTACGVGSARLDCVKVFQISSSLLEAFGRRYAASFFVRVLFRSERGMKLDGLPQLPDVLI
jgi:hypothetical protein